MTTHDQTEQPEPCHFCGFVSAHANDGGVHAYAYHMDDGESGKSVSFCWTRECPGDRSALWEHCDYYQVGGLCSECGKTPREAFRTVRARRGVTR